MTTLRIKYEVNNTGRHEFIELDDKFIEKLIRKDLSEKYFGSNSFKFKGIENG